MTSASDSESVGESERRALTGRAGIVAAGTLVSKLLGLVREQVLAALFTRAAWDAFTIAWRIPNLLRALLAEGAVQQAVLPVLTKVREQDGEDAARGFFRALRGLSLAILVAVSIAGVLAAAPLVHVFAPDFDPARRDTAITLTRWAFPYIFFMGTAALGLAALNTHGRFVATSFAPALLNVASIAAAFALPAWLVAHGREPILAMAIGGLAGGLLQVVAQWPSLRAIGYLQRPSLDFGHPRVREALARMGPMLIGIGIYYVDSIVAPNLLSRFGEGTVSYFNFAFRLCDLPQGIFVMALSSAALPSLARLVAKKDFDEVGKTFAYGMRLSLFVAIPATLLFVVLAEPLVVAIFQRGKFQAHDSLETARALAVQGLGIWMVACVRQLLAVYYALGAVRFTVLVSALDFGAFLGLGLLLRGALGHVGISVALTGSNAVQMLLLWIGLRSRLPRLHMKAVIGSAARNLVAALAAAAGAWAVARALGGLLHGGFWARLVPGAVASAVFVALFLAGAAIGRSAELTALRDTVARRRAR